MKTNILHNFEGGGQPSSIASLYCLKAIGAFFVVCIHFPLFFFQGHAALLWSLPILFTAVPCFFMISGFFLYTPTQDQAIIRCKKALLKILALIISANLFYIFVDTLPRLLYHCVYLNDGLYEFPVNSLYSAIRFIFIGTNFNGPFWYLNAYAEVLIVLLIALHFRMERLLWWGIPVFILCGLLFGRYSFIHSMLLNHALLCRNFLTTGLPCFAIGWLMRKYQQDLILFFRHPLFLLIILLLLSHLEKHLLQQWDYDFFYHHGDLLITTIPTSAAMMLFCISHPNLGHDTYIEVIGKQYSSDIYIYHYFIGYCIKLALRLFSLEVYPAFVSIAVFFATLMFVIMLHHFRKRLTLHRNN